MASAAPVSLVPVTAFYRHQTHLEPDTAGGAEGEAEGNRLKKRDRGHQRKGRRDKKKEGKK